MTAIDHFGMEFQWVSFMRDKHFNVDSAFITERLLYCWLKVFCITKRNWDKTQGGAPWTDLKTCIDTDIPDVSRLASSAEHLKTSINDEIGQMDNRNHTRWVYFLYFIQKSKILFHRVFILRYFKCHLMYCGAPGALGALNRRLGRLWYWASLGTSHVNMIGPIYTRDGSSVWDELGQRTAARLIIRLCINTGKQTDHPSRRAIG